MKYLVAIPIPEPASTLLRNLQNELQPPTWRKTIDPHITLLAPDQPLLPPNGAAAAFARTPLHTPSFEVTSNGIEIFTRRHYSTIVLRAEPYLLLKKLFCELVLQAIWQSTRASTRRPYVPHITIANGLSNHELRQTQIMSAHINPSISFECTEITLYAKQASWPKWQEIARRLLPESHENQYGSESA